MRCLYVLAFGALACGQSQVVGYACPEQGCPEPSVQPLEDCGLTISPPRRRLTGDADLCWVYSLSELGDPDELIYLTGARPLITANSHHVDVRLINGAMLDPVRYPDGEYEEGCTPLWNRLPVAPLLATADSSELWDFSGAPLVTTPSHRVMINQHYVGNSEQSVAVQLELTCQRARPEVVTQSFAFVREELEDVAVAPALSRTLCTSCNFTTDVELRRLFRRTHLIEEFRVTLSGEPVWGPAGEEGLCRTDPLEPWRCAFDEPLTVSRREVLEWECLYLNMGDSPVRVGRGANDECSLFGFYTLRSGPVGEPQNCVRRERASESACSHDTAP